MTVKEYELSEDQYEFLLEASKPVSYLIANGTEPLSPQVSANQAWENLGKTMGFLSDTVRPSPRGDRFFTAEIGEKTP